MTAAAVPIGYSTATLRVAVPFPTSLKRRAVRHALDLAYLGTPRCAVTSIPGRPENADRAAERAPVPRVEHNRALRSTDTASLQRCIDTERRRRVVGQELPFDRSPKAMKGWRSWPRLARCRGLGPIASCVNSEHVPGATRRGSLESATDLVLNERHRRAAVGEHARLAPQRLFRA